MAMFQPSTSRDPLLTRGWNSESDSGESVEEHAFDYNSNVGESVYFTNVDEDQTLTPISESTVVEGVDANVLKLPREDQRFTCVEFSPDWKLVVTLTSDGTFSVWDTTDEFVLLGSKRLHHDGRTLKCVAFDPYVKEAVLMCFDWGDIIRANLGGPATSDAPKSSQDEALFHMERVHTCEGRAESRFDHFTFASDRKIMVYYNLDGVFAAIQFQEQERPKEITLSKEFKLEQNPNIYVSEQSILVTSVMKSSEDLESTDEKMETLFWSEFDFEDTEAENNPNKLEGKGYLSGDGKYVLISLLATKHESQCCQIEVHRSEDIKSSVNMKHGPFIARTLNFASNHPHLGRLDRKQFRFFHADDGNIKPLIAIQQTNSIGNRLIFWDTNSDTLIHEIDLTLDKVQYNFISLIDCCGCHKEFRRFSEVKSCWSVDYKWLGVCSIRARMVGLVCVRSGVFAWTSHVPQISRDDMGFCTLSFDPVGMRLMISLGKMICLFEPPCLSTKPQKHPMHDNLCLSQASGRYIDFEILEMAKEWPKQVLFNVLVACQRAKPEYQRFLLDVAISTTSKRVAMIYKTYEGLCMLSIVDYTKTSSWESLWLVVMSRWNWYAFANNTSPLVKVIGEAQRRKGISVFYYPNEETCNEQVILLSSEGGVELLDLDSKLNQLSDWRRVSEDTCLSLAQTKDRRHVISLANRHVLVVDLNKKMVVETVEYSFGLSHWWESFLDRVKFFAYSHFGIFTGQECDKRHKLFLQDRLQGLFDVSDDGKTILIGWDKEQNKSLVITHDKTEEQFRIEWDEAQESLYQCSMLTEDGKWLGFIDYEKMRSGDIVICVVDMESNHQQRIWLGSNELITEPSRESQPSITNFFLKVDKSKEKLTTLGLEEIGPHNTLKQFSIEKVHDVTHAQDHQSLLEDIIQPTNLDKYNEGDSLSVFNMSVASISNFQRVLVEEGEYGLEKMAKCALQNKVKVSDVYRFRQDDEHNHTSFLTYALERKETNLVQLCLHLIKDGLFPFDSASAMVKDSFFKLLFSYHELFLPILKRNYLMFKVAEVRVPVQVFKSQDAISNVVFTSDTILEPNDYFVKMATEDLQKSKSAGHLEWITDHGEGRKVLSSVSFHYIANACKVGLNGIVRKLLMLDVDSSIFETELVRATITWKWEKLWKKRCVRQLYLYILFLIFFTTYAVGIGIFGDSLMHNKIVGLRISFPLLGAVILTIFFFSDECMQLKTYVNDGKEVFGTYMWGLKHYFLDSQWNLVELSSYFLVLVLIPIFHVLCMFEVGSKKALFVIVAIDSILAWFKLWYFAQPFERTGALVLLISNVIQDCIPFLILAFVVLVGFSVALYVLFQCVSSPISASFSEQEDEVLIHESFESLWRSVLTLFYAMVGTFEVEVYYNHQSLSWLTTLIFILYMALEMIVMLNMLIAIMGDTFDRVKNEEDIQVIIGRARFIDAYEASLSTKQIREVEKKIGKFVYVLTPKDGQYGTKKISWKGKINAIEDNIRKAIKDNKEKMENKMEQHFEQIKDFLELHYNKDQDLLLSIAKKIEALEMETNR